MTFLTSPLSINGKKRLNRWTLPTTLILKLFNRSSSSSSGFSALTEVQCQFMIDHWEICYASSKDVLLSNREPGRDRRDICCVGNEVVKFASGDFGDFRNRFLCKLRQLPETKTLAFCAN